jgi:hypothetical protein
MFDKSAFSMVGSYLFQRNLTISVDKQLGYQSCSKQTGAKHRVTQFGNESELQLKSFSVRLKARIDNAPVSFCPVHIDSRDLRTSFLNFIFASRSDLPILMMQLFSSPLTKKAFSTLF